MYVNDSIVDCNIFIIYVYCQVGVDFSIHFSRLQGCLFFLYPNMIIPNIGVVANYLQYKKQESIQCIKQLLLDLMDRHTDSLIEQFTQITGYSIFAIVSYEYWPEIDGAPMVRINFANDPQPRVYTKMEAMLIHQIRQNVDRRLEKQADLTIKATVNTPA